MGAASYAIWPKSPTMGQKSLPTGMGPPYWPAYRPPMPFNTQLPFLATLKLSNVLCLTNDLILHVSYWPPVSSKIPSDYPKFNGKAKEDPQAHVMTYHLWCFSNSYVDDSFSIHLFQRTLTGAVAKWYIELPRSTYHDFNSLAMAFLTHF